MIFLAVFAGEEQFFNPYLKYKPNLRLGGLKESNLFTEGANNYDTEKNSSYYGIS